MDLKPTKEWWVFMPADPSAGRANPQICIFPTPELAHAWLADNKPSYGGEIKSFEVLKWG